MHKIIKFVLIYIVCINVCVARYANVNDALAETIQRDVEIIVHSDGTSEIDVKRRIKILNERGREINSKVALSYNGDNSKLEIISGKTVVANKSYEIDKSLIEDKPLASDVQGFDQMHQVLLAFPNADVGAELFLHYKITINKAEFPNFFEYMFDLSGSYVRDATLSIKSELPLYYRFNDPDDYLAIKQGNDRGYETLDVNLLKPIYIDIVDERRDSLNPSKFPWVFVATSDNWNKFANKIAPEYLKVARQKLPTLYNDIVQTAKNEPDEIAKIEYVAAALNEKIQYMGDWKTANGRHVPQKLSNVAKNRLGDCKDFATGMVAILNKLGIKANVVLVQRGFGIYDTSMVELPGGFHFNHAMVRVTLKNGDVLWVDPTNFFSTARYTLADIADRQVLVLDSPSYLSRIPQSKPEDNVVRITRERNIESDDVVQVKASLILSGMAAIPPTGANLQVSQSTIDNTIIREIGNYDTIIEKSVQAPLLDTRIVRDVEFKANFTEKNIFLNTNAGRAILISNTYASRYIFNDEYVSDIYLGPPATTEDVIILNNVRVSKRDPLNYNLSSPWFDLSRKVEYEDNRVIITQKSVSKVSWIYNETIKSAEYNKFAAGLAKNFKHGIAIVIE